MNTICVIPARGNSKRLPNKNILNFCGKPLLYQTFQAAKKSKIFDRIIVSTEDKKIKDIATKLNIEVLERAKSLSEDEVSATDVCIDVINKIESKKTIIDHVICLQPTSPLRSHIDIQNAFMKYKSANANFLVSVTKVDPHYFHWAMNKKNNKWEMYFGKKYLKERLYLPCVYRPNGAIKIAKKNKMIKTKNFFGSKLEVYEMPYERSIHIAYAVDFEIAQYLKKKSENNK